MFVPKHKTVYVCVYENICKFACFALDFLLIHVFMHITALYTIKMQKLHFKMIVIIIVMLVCNF